MSRSMGRIRKRYNIPVVLYDTALNTQAYGNTVQMGDFFNDIMGAVVPGWDSRPDWMKKIQVKPDPAKILPTVMKAVPPKMVGGVLQKANQYGFDMYYQTPGGSVPITPSLAESAYANFPAFMKAKDMFGGIPSWLIMAGGVGLFVLIFSQAKKH